MDALYRNATIWLPELARNSDWIKACSFEGCLIEGPAVVIFKPAPTFSGNIVFHAASLDALLIELPFGRTVVGVLAFDECRFYNCRFSRIGVITAPPERKRWVKQAPDEPDWWRYIEAPDSPE